MLKKLFISIFYFFICSIFLLTSTKAVKATEIPPEIKYKVIKVKTLKDFEHKMDEGYVYSFDGLDLNKLAVPQKKKVFVSMLLPNIEIVNKEIDRDIKIVEVLSKKKIYTAQEKKELDRIFELYKVEKYDWADLKPRMIKYPTSLILSQSALESGWGTSKVFKEKNNLFGMNAYKNTKATYKEYDSIKDSVKDFVLTLSRVHTYKSLRTSVNAGESPEKIAKHLTGYSELKGKYVVKVHDMLKYNDFTKYD